jgi:hypothetical protein
MTLKAQLFNVYFTSAPYNLYNEASNEGNIAYAGIGLGLIHSQSFFWIANCGTILCFYFNSTNILFILFITWLYYHSISKTIDLLRLCTINYSD